MFDHNSLLPPRKKNELKVSLMSVSFLREKQLSRKVGVIVITFFLLLIISINIRFPPRILTHIIMATNCRLQMKIKKFKFYRRKISGDKPNTNSYDNNSIDVMPGRTRHCAGRWTAGEEEALRRRTVGYLCYKHARWSAIDRTAKHL